MSVTDHRWTSGQAHLLTPESLDLVRKALGKGLVFGFRSFYCGARGPDDVSFSDFDAYRAAIESSRPGDWFTLWSVPIAQNSGSVLLHKHARDIKSVELEQIRAWLSENAMHEFFAVGRAGPDVPPTAASGDIDNFDDLQALVSGCSPAGEVAVVNLFRLDSAAHRTERSLVNAKRPNRQGEVPLGGAY